MDATLTQNQLSGRAIGALFFTGFGAVWITLGFYAKEFLRPSTVAMVIVVVVALLSAILWLLHKAKLFPTTVDDPAVLRSFHWINALQWIAGGIVAFALGKLHLGVYIVSAITAIVGLHLFPLAKLFRYPLHYVTAIALVLWAGAGLLVVPIEQLQGTTALGTGIILWLSAAISLVKAVQAIRASGRPAIAARYTQRISA